MSGSRHTWEVMRHWQLVLPPSRPSARHLRIIRRALQPLNRSEPVAVLGSTPEYRDLLHELGFSTVCVFDRCKKFHRAMSHLRVYRSKETLVYGDWLARLGDYHGKFAAILSDLTSGNVPYVERTRFYRLIGAGLAPKGLFVDKILTHPGPNLRLHDLERKYTKLPMNLLHINHFSCEALFCSELIDRDQVVDSTAFYRHIRASFTAPRARAFATASQLITPLGCRWWYGRRWADLSKTYCPDLRLIADHPDEPGSPYYGRVRLFISRRQRS